MCITINRKYPSMKLLLLQILNKTKVECRVLLNPLLYQLKKYTICCDYYRKKV